jgi:hypothetical protein
MIRSIALGAAVILGSASLAAAQTADEQAACKDDAFRICPHAIPDRDRVLQCFMANRDAVSPACRAVLAQYFPPEPAPKKTTTPRKPRPPGKGPIDLSPTAAR